MPRTAGDAMNALFRLACRSSPGQTDLMSCGQTAQKQIRSQRHLKGLGQRARQFLTLVKAAFAQAGFMQRHRNDGVGPRQIAAGLHQKCSQKVQHRGIRTEFPAPGAGFSAHWHTRRKNESVPMEAAWSGILRTGSGARRTWPEERRHRGQ